EIQLNFHKMVQEYTDLIVSRPSSVTDVHSELMSPLDFDLDFSRDWQFRCKRESQEQLNPACDPTFILDSEDYCAIERVIDGAESLNRIVTQLCTSNANHPHLRTLPALSHSRGITRYVVAILGGSPVKPPCRKLSNSQFDALIGNLTHALMQNKVSPLAISYILRNAEKTRRKLVKRASFTFSKDPCIII
ncbi:hypothetical protein L0F63_005685, partial [Massospora cicadina]